MAAVTACLGVAMLTAAVTGFAAGHLGAVQRVLMAVPGALLLLPPEMLPFAPAVYAAAAAAGFILWRQSRTNAPTVAAVQGR